MSRFFSIRAARPEPDFSTSQAARGFTLLEAVAVLVLLGILSAYAVPRLASNADSTRRSELDMLIAAVRQVQVSSMNTVSPWSIQILSGSFATTSNVNGTPTAMTLPGRAGSTVTFSKLNVSSGGTLTFDAFGSPGNVNVTITTSAGNFCVHRVTGFIEAPACL